MHNNRQVDYVFVFRDGSIRALTERRREWVKGWLEGRGIEYKVKRIYHVN